MQTWGHVCVLTAYACMLRACTVCFHVWLRGPGWVPTVRVDPQKRGHAHEMSCKFDYNCEFEAMFETAFGPGSVALLGFFKRKSRGRNMITGSFNWWFLYCNFEWRLIGIFRTGNNKSKSCHIKRILSIKGLPHQTIIAWKLYKAKALG